MPKYVELSASIALDMTAMLGKQIKKTLDLGAVSAEEARKMCEEQEQENK